MQVTYPLVRGKVARGTLLTRCGVPAYEDDYATITTEGVVSVVQTANYDDGEAIQVTNMNGKKCVNKPAEPELLSEGLDITFCGVDPDFYTLATGFPKIVDPLTGLTTGFIVDRSVRPFDVRWALDLWSDATDSDGCGEDDEVPYGYLLWPFLSGGKIGDYTIENGAVTFSVTGVTTNDGPGWGTGPYLVVTDAAGDPDVLQAALTEFQHQYVNRTLVPPPLPSDGLVPLDDPADADATIATAGDAPAPGTWNGVRPFDLATLITDDPTASPATAWTTGEFVILGDGSWAHWSSTAWVAGKA